MRFTFPIAQLGDSKEPAVNPRDIPFRTCRTAAFALLALLLLAAAEITPAERIANRITQNPPAPDAFTERLCNLARAVDAKLSRNQATLPSGQVVSIAMKYAGQQWGSVTFRDVIANLLGEKFTVSELGLIADSLKGEDGPPGETSLACAASTVDARLKPADTVIARGFVDFCRKNISQLLHQLEAARRLRHPLKTETLPPPNFAPEASSALSTSAPAGIFEHGPLSAPVNLFDGKWHHTPELEERVRKNAESFRIQMKESGKGRPDAGAEPTPADCGERAP